MKQLLPPLFFFSSMDILILQELQPFTHKMRLFPSVCLKKSTTLNLGQIDVLFRKLCNFTIILMKNRNFPSSLTYELIIFSQDFMGPFHKYFFVREGLLCTFISTSFQFWLILHRKQTFKKYLEILVRKDNPHHSWQEIHEKRRSY